MRGDRGLQAGNQLFGRHIGRHGDLEAFEVVMVVIVLGIVMRRAGIEIVFRGRIDAQQNTRIDHAIGGLHHAHTLTQPPADLAGNAVDGAFVHQVGFVEQHQIGAGELVFIELVQRAFVIQFFVLGAHRIDPVGIVGKTPGGDGGAVKHGDHAVDRYAGTHFRPAEGLDQRLGQRQAGGLDHDVVGRIRQVEYLFNGRQEVIGHRAADAAIGELEDILVGAVGVATALEQLAVDGEIAEFVDDERELLAVCLFDQVPDHRRLAGAEKAGDNGCRYFSGDRHALSASSAGYKNTHRPMPFAERTPARGLTIRPTSGLLAHGSRPRPGLPAGLTAVANSELARRLQLRGQPGLRRRHCLPPPVPVPGSSALPT